MPSINDSFNTSLSGNQSQNTAASQSTQRAAQQATAQSSSTSFIPEYSQTPILERIAQTAENYAPEAYRWGMHQFNKNQGNIDSLMNDAKRYEGQPQQAVDMGAAEAAVTGAGEAGLQNSIRDLQDYGIDPSSGRYAGLDRAAQVQNAAAAAGAGNMQRNADMARANTERNQAISAGLQNSAFGNQVGEVANSFLSTGMRLPYSPLGNRSQSSSQSSGWSTGDSNSNSQGTSNGFSEGFGASSGFNTGTGTGTGTGGGGNGPGGGPTKMPPQRPGERPPPNPPASPEENATGLQKNTNPNPASGPGGERPPREAGPSSNFPDDPNQGVGGGPLAGDPVYMGGQSPYDANNPGGAFDPGGSGDYWGGDFSPTVGGGDFGGGGFGGEYRGGPIGYADGGGVDPDQEQDAPGGYDPEADGPAVPTGRSPTQGQAIDDVPSKLTVGEFVMPNDVVKWKGEEYFQKLISQSREARQSIMAVHGQLQGKQHNLGGAI